MLQDKIDQAGKMNMELDKATTDVNPPGSANGIKTNAIVATATNTSLKTSYDIDIVRLIGQYLINMGLKQTANSLLEESGLHQLDHPLAIKFREYVMSGDWERSSRAVEDVVNLAISMSSMSNWIQPAAQSGPNQTNPSSISSSNGKHQNGCSSIESQKTTQQLQQPSSSTTTSSSSLPSLSFNLSNRMLEQKRRVEIANMRLAIAEQKFLELLEDGDRIRALRCLRGEITPLCNDAKRVQFLTTLLMCKSLDEIHLRANWSGKNQQTRQILFDRLSQTIPPPILLPPKRLETLLNQAVELQRGRCLLHLERSSDPQRASSSATPNNDRSSLTFNKRENFSQATTIISDQEYLGCNGDCNRFEQHHSETLATNGQHDNDHMSTSQSELDSTNGGATSNNSTMITASNSNFRNGNTFRDSRAEAQYDNHVIDLKSDHVCAADNFPLHSKQVLESHRSEVWYCKFSNDGTKLATGGLNGQVIIWQLDEEAKILKEKRIIECSCYSISCLSWSPDDMYLLICGSDERQNLWVWNSETSKMVHVTSRDKEEETVTTTCSWHMSGTRFAAASTKGTFHIYDVIGFKCGGREGVRVQCLSFLHKDPNVLLAADTLNRIKAYRVDCDSDPNLSIKSDEEDVIEERYAIVSFVVDSDDKYIAINVRDQGVSLWDLKRKTLLRILLGVSQRNMTIFSTFSSPDATFLASGSEDGRVYIYNCAKEKPVAILSGHRRCVNCVSWNPRFPELMASVSDDHSVRLWAPADARNHFHLCRSLSQTIHFSNSTLQ